MLEPRQTSSLLFVIRSLVNVAGDEGNGKLYDDPVELELSESMLIIAGNAVEKSEVVGTGGCGTVT